MIIAEPGSVSAGTLKTDDLLSAFIDALENLGGDSEVVAAGEDALRLLYDVENAAEKGESIINTLVKHGLVERSIFEEVRTLVSEVLSEIFDTLNDHAPEGMYFGAHPGDGADFGFWQCEDDLQHEDGS